MNVLACAAGVMLQVLQEALASLEAGFQGQQQQSESPGGPADEHTVPRADLLAAGPNW